MPSAPSTTPRSWLVEHANRRSVHRGSIELARHHAHDHECVAVQHERSPDGGWIAVEASTPEAIAQLRPAASLNSTFESSLVSARPWSAGTPSTSKNSGVTMWTRTCSAGSGLIHGDIDRRFPEDRRERCRMLMQSLIERVVKAAGRFRFVGSVGPRAPIRWHGAPATAATGRSHRR